jgi:hypothetical protein
MFMASPNVLIIGMERVGWRIARFKELVRSFYFEVLLSVHACPRCGGALVMVRTSKARCSACSLELDPTAAFQQSSCCNAPLKLQRTHYACTVCGSVVPSRFLFEERVLDADYFRQAMRMSRDRARERRERVRLMLLGTRSGALSIMALPGLDEVPGLIDALTGFVQGMQAARPADFAGSDAFDMAAYRRVILDALCGCSVLFDAIPRVGQDARKDRVRRFVTLLYMEHDHEITMSQYGEKIVVEKYGVEA